MIWRLDLVPASATAPAVRLAALALVFVVALVSVQAGCRTSPEEHVRLLVIGIDGADWEAIERLWGEGRLPNLRALAERGVATRLATNYGKSPVIWTTMATGVAPHRHGITDFVVPTERGDLPVSSSSRRVPALWNMLSSAGLRVGVVSWWASWPAEEVEGFVVSDRVLSDSALAEVSGLVHPTSLAANLPELLERALAAPKPAFERRGVGARDRLSVTVGRRLLEAEDLDLVMVYLRGVDVVSHLQWKYFEPDRFGIGEAERAAAGDPVTATYEATDQAIGLLMASAGEDWDVLVVSDHGFVAMAQEEARVQLDFDRVLDRLDFLARDGAGAVDLERSRLYSYASRPGDQLKTLRFGGAAAASETRSALVAELERFQWGDGSEAFRVRDPRPRQRREGADLAVRVLPSGAGDRLLLDGAEVDVGQVVFRQSGTHHRSTPGVLFAAGPHVDPEAVLAGIHIHDFAPTVLWALGLPVAEDFVGVARRELFVEELRRARPLVEIATWGERETQAPSESALDDEILEDLKALGYLDD